MVFCFFCIVFCLGNYTDGKNIRIAQNDYIRSHFCGYLFVFGVYCKKGGDIKCVTLNTGFCYFFGVYGEIKEPILFYNVIGGVEMGWFTKRRDEKFKKLIREMLDDVANFPTKMPDLLEGIVIGFLLYNRGFSKEELLSFLGAVEKELPTMPVKEAIDKILEGK